MVSSANHTVNYGAATVKLAMAFAVFLLSPAVQAAEPSSLCPNLRQLNWKDESAWKQPIGMYAGDLLPGDTGSAIEEIEARIAPLTLSEGLKSDLAEFSDEPVLYTQIKGTDLYFFGITEGSGNCAYNLWAQRSGGVLDEIGNVPIDPPDVCDAPIVFGEFDGKPVIIKRQFDRASPKDGGLPTKVSVVEADREKWSDICEIAVR